MIRKFVFAVVVLSTGAFSLCTSANAAGVSIVPASVATSSMIQTVQHHHGWRDGRHRRWDDRRHHGRHHRHWRHRRPPVVCRPERIRYWDGYRWRRGFEERCRPRW